MKCRFYIFAILVLIIIMNIFIIKIQAEDQLQNLLEEKQQIIKEIGRLDKRWKVAQGAEKQRLETEIGKRDNKLAILNNEINKKRAESTKSSKKKPSEIEPGEINKPYKTKWYEEPLVIAAIVSAIGGIVAALIHKMRKQ